jgi:hypothetical protein
VAREKFASAHGTPAFGLNLLDAKRAGASGDLQSIA